MVLVRAMTGDGQLTAANLTANLTANRQPFLKFYPNVVESMFPVCWPCSE
jgi:hypothetical protein